MIQRFEPEDRATKPPDFDGWLEELQMLADCEGEAAALGVLMLYAPVECVRYLVSQQTLLHELLARGRYADRCRMTFGMAVGWEKSR